LKAAIVAAQMEKNKMPLTERAAIRAVAMSQRDSLRVDDGGYTEIVL